MFIEGIGLARSFILPVAFFFIWLQRITTKKGGFLTQGGRVTGRFDVVGHHEGQPQQIV